jgi:putative flippase GtrA
MGWTYLFYELIKWDLIVSTILAILLTQLFQFPMSKEWAFRYRHRTRIVQFLFFLGSRFGSYVIVTLATWIGPTYFNFHWIISQLAGVILGTVFNFIVANWLVFVEPAKKAKSNPPNAPTDTPVNSEDIK